MFVNSQTLLSQTSTQPKRDEINGLSENLPENQQADEASEQAVLFGALFADLLRVEAEQGAAAAEPFDEEDAALPQTGIDLPFGLSAISSQFEFSADQVPDPSIDSEKQLAKAPEVQFQLPDNLRVDRPSTYKNGSFKLDELLGKIALSGLEPKPLLNDQPTTLSSALVNQPALGLDGLKPLAHNAQVMSAETPLRPHIQTPAFREALADQVKLMIGKDWQTADFQLNPPELGPLKIKLAMQNEQLSVQFASPHAAVRDAVEAALPRLRDFLQDQALNLVQVDIGQGDSGGEFARAEDETFARSGASHCEADLDDLETEPVSVVSVSPNSLLDLYA